MLGILSLTTVISFTSIVLPINVYVHLFIFAGLFLYALLDRKYVSHVVQVFRPSITRDMTLLFFIGICLFAGIVFASGVTTDPDTGGYHAQAVKWINEYGATPGLGNLHYRLAFNSSWLVFSSFFDVSAFDGKSYHVANLIAYAVGIAICYSGFSKITTNNITVSSILRCLLILFFVSQYKRVVSLSTDYPVITILLYVLILAVEFVEKKEGIGNANQTEELQCTYLLIVIFSFFAITVKLNAAPILLFPLLFFTMIKNGKLRLLVAGLSFGTVIITPFVIRNLILSGYFVFPYPSPNIFRFDWKVPYEDALFVKQQTQYWAIRPQADYMSIPGMTFREWFPGWFEKRIIGDARITIYLLLGSILLPLLILFSVAKKKHSLLLIQGVLLSGVLFWLLSAPDPRLGAAWILGYGIMPIAVLLYYIYDEVKFRPEFASKLRHLAYGLLVIFCLWSIRVSGFRARLIGEQSYLIWTIEELPQATLCVFETHSGVDVYAPIERRQAWNGDIPNTPYALYDLELRGDTMEDGFRVSQRQLSAESLETRPCD